MFYIPRLQDYFSIKVNSLEIPKLTMAHRMKCWKYRAKVERTKWLAKRCNVRPIDNIDVGFLTAWNDPINLGIGLLNPGGEVYIPAGAYTQTDTSITGVANLRIRGSGVASVIKAAKTVATAFEVFDLVGKDHIDISDIYINGDNTTIEAAGFASEHDHGININNCQYVRIHGCTIVNTCGDGIMAYGKAGAKAEDVVISENFIKVVNVSKVTSIGRNCIAICDNAERINIVNNNLCGGFPAAIDLEPATDLDYTLDGVVIENNTIYDPDGYGINLNATCATGGKTNTIRNITITGNQIDQAYDCGIKLLCVALAGTALIQNVKIAENNIRNCIDAASTAVGSIQVQGDVRNLQVLHNTVRASGFHGFYALGVAAQVFWDILGNQVFDSQYEGIFLDGVNGGEIEYVSIKGNSCFNNSKKSADASDGILCKYTDYLDISDNHCSDNQGTDTQKYGIELQNCDHVILGRFAAWENSTGPFRATGLTSVQVPNAKVVGYWEIDNVAANVGNTEMNLGAVPGRLTMPFDGFVIGIGVYSNAETSAGTLDVYLSKSGILDSGVNAQLDTTNKQAHYQLQLDTPKAFSAGDQLSIIYATSADFAPNGSADIRACLVIMS